MRWWPLTPQRRLRPLRTQRTGNAPDSPYSGGLVLLIWGHGLAPFWLVSRPLRNARPAPLVGRVELDPSHASRRGHRWWWDGGRRDLGWRGVGRGLWRG